MVFPERFSNLPEYAFPRLRRLLDAHPGGGDPVYMSIGEPTHPFPDWVAGVIADNAAGFGKYPPNEGSQTLLAAISGWLKRRYGVDMDPQTRLMALNGSREGLFNAALALCPEKTAAGAQPAVLIPNPFYQVYAVAARAVGAEPVFVTAHAGNKYLPDFHALPDALLARTEIVYLCSPSNPQGAIADADYLERLLKLAEKHDFRIFADECYSEIYRTTPPPGILEIAARTGADPERVLAFHSLSKRSNLPGLRSGFVAGGPQCIRRIRRLRNYAGAPLPLPLQAVAERVWADETHVRQNRARYLEKYEIADEIFAAQPGYHPPEAGFFLWLPVDDDEAAALKLWRETGVRVLPGSYLSRDVNGENPGKRKIRAALVAPLDEMQRGLTRLRDCLYD